MKLEGKQIGILVALLLGVVILLLPGQDSMKYRFDPLEISRSIAEREDHIDPQTLSEWIIEGRRDYYLVDIRNEKEYGESSIKGADNIPMDTLLKKETLDELPEDKMIILYSNGTSHASQAWLVLKTAGVDAYVLEGGLNYWNRAILDPKAPGPGASDDEILVYKAKLAVKGYFGGEVTSSAGADSKAEKPKKVFKRPKKKKKKLKGC